MNTVEKKGPDGRVRIFFNPPPDMILEHTSHCEATFRSEGMHVRGGASFEVGMSRRAEPTVVLVTFHPEEKSGATRVTFELVEKPKKEPDALDRLDSEIQRAAAMKTIKP